MALAPELQARIETLVNDSEVLLFMKGTRHFPQCGFSATVTQILDGLGLQYKTINVLTDPDIREGVKEFSKWPTIPQLYVRGEFVGGCDIVREMYLAGELQSLLGVSENVDAPQMTISESAAKAFRDASGDKPEMLRVEVGNSYEYALSVDQPASGDFQVDAGHGITILIDKASAKRANGIHIDYSPVAGGGFKIENPSEPARVKELHPKEYQAMCEQADGAKVVLIDVRTQEERDTANIAGSLFLDDATRQELSKLDPESTRLVFFCHSGRRSRAAAEQWLSQSDFKHIFNLSGGIDAWSREVDPTVPRY